VLPSISAKCMELLDALVASTEPGAWIWHGDIPDLDRCVHDRTYRRALPVLRGYGLIQTRAAEHCRIVVRVTDLGRALIDAHHTAEE